MVRVCNIKFGIMVNEDLVELDFFVCLLFIYFWMLVDWEGCFEDCLKWIKVEVFFYDNVDVDLMLDDLVKVGFIYCYEVVGVKLIQVFNFVKYQIFYVCEQVSFFLGVDVE